MTPELVLGLMPLPNPAPAVITLVVVTCAVLAVLFFLVLLGAYLIGPYLPRRWLGAETGEAVGEVVLVSTLDVAAKAPRRAVWVGISALGLFALAALAGSAYLTAIRTEPIQTGPTASREGERWNERELIEYLWSHGFQFEVVRDRGTTLDFKYDNINRPHATHIRALVCIDLKLSSAEALESVSRTRWNGLAWGRFFLVGDTGRLLQIREVLPGSRPSYALRYR